MFAIVCERGGISSDIDWPELLTVNCMRNVEPWLTVWKWIFNDWTQQHHLHALMLESGVHWAQGNHVCIEVGSFCHPLIPSTAAPLSTGAAIAISVVITFSLSLWLSPATEGQANVGHNAPAGHTYEEVSSNGPGDMIKAISLSCIVQVQKVIRVCSREQKSSHPVYIRSSCVYSKLMVKLFSMNGVFIWVLIHWHKCVIIHPVRKPSTS